MNAKTTVAASMMYILLLAVLANGWIGKLRHTITSLSGQQ